MKRKSLLPRKKKSLSKAKPKPLPPNNRLISSFRLDLSR